MITTTKKRCNVDSTRQEKEDGGPGEDNNNDDDGGGGNYKNGNAVVGGDSDSDNDNDSDEGIVDSKNNGAGTRKQTKEKCRIDR